MSSALYTLSGISMGGIGVANNSQAKLGLTTTVREQVASIENAADSFEAAILAQRKQQQTVQLAMGELETLTKQAYHDLNKEVEDRLNYLQDLFNQGAEAQEKEFEYLEMQNATLHQEHESLQQVSAEMVNATSDIESSVGL